MSPLKFSILLSVSSILSIATSSPALPAKQHLNARGQYQGGWPLALTGSNSGSCPTEASVQCASTEANPECCPSGQTCIWGGFSSMNYCCPTSKYQSLRNPLLKAKLLQTTSPSTSTDSSNRCRLQYSRNELSPLRKYNLEYVHQRPQRFLLLRAKFNRRSPRHWDIRRPLRAERSGRA